MNANQLTAAEKLFIAINNINPEAVLDLLTDDKIDSSSLNEQIIKQALLKIVDALKEDNTNKIDGSLIIAYIINYKNILNHTELCLLTECRVCIINSMFSELNTNSSTFNKNTESYQLLKISRDKLDQREHEISNQLNQSKNLIEAWDGLLDYINNSKNAIFFIWETLKTYQKNPSGIDAISLEKKMALLLIMHTWIQNSNTASHCQAGLKKLADVINHILLSCLTDMRKKNQGQKERFTIKEIKTLFFFFFDWGLSQYKESSSAMKIRKKLLADAREHICEILSDSSTKLNAIIALYDLDEKGELYYSTDLLRLLIELYDLITNPGSLDQKNRSFCGVASYCIQLLKDDPHVFIIMAVDLIRQGQTMTPMKITSTFAIAKNSDGISDFILQSLRNQLNILLPYDASSTQEGVLGCTRPREIVLLLQATGYHNIRETTIVHTADDTELPLPVRAMFGGVYSDQHQIFQNRQENLNYVINQMQNNATDSVIFLLRMPLIDHIVKNKPLIDANKPVISFFIPIEFTHFINVNSLTLSDTGLLDIHFTSYGKTFSCSMQQEEFAKYFDGAIIATPPNIKPLLSSTLDSSLVKKS